MSLIKSKAIVLGASDYSESTKIVSLLTRENGHLRLMAKGARSAKSKIKGMIEPFTVVEIQFTLRDPDKLGNLTDSQIVNSAEFLRVDLVKYSLVSVLAEILDRSIHPGEGSEALFDLIENSIENLKETKSAEQFMIKVFSKLLIELGIQPETSRCVSCGSTENLVAFSIQLGGVLCQECKRKVVAEDMVPLNPGQQKILQLIFDSDHKKMEFLKLDKNQIKYFLNLLLNLFQFHLEIRLNSRKFLEEMLR